ncbi:acyl-CoA carboxylase epsilon subunit [Streptomyces sp. XH2]|uniref:acyl-CoA carboxylase epsilon subunit n=1 Tax=Streptomyces sp. XH2 TaxID=3412483 RepID=UPI003C7B1F31
MIKVVRGNPTPEELAAALAVVQARAAARSAAAPGDGADAARPEWSAPARRLAAARMAKPGPRAWRTTYWPS